jgi:hypothetical protein
MPRGVFLSFLLKRARDHARRRTPIRVLADAYQEAL